MGGLKIPIKKKGIIGIAFIVAVLCLAIIYFGILRHTGPKPPPKLQENIENIITETLATQKVVPKENIKIHFCTQTQENSNIWAVGVMISQRESLMFLYDASAQKIDNIEDNYIATSDTELRALTILEDMVSKWTGVEIIPCNLAKVDNAYNFMYYDGYQPLFSSWSFGWATVYLDNRTVEWGPHSM